MGTEGAREYTLFMQTDDGLVEISKEIADVKISYSEEMPELANMQLEQNIRRIYDAGARNGM